LCFHFAWGNAGAASFALQYKDQKSTHTQIKKNKAKKNKRNKKNKKEEQNGVPMKSTHFLVVKCELRGVAEVETPIF
jgi:hypothetical protein